jgi:ribonuclease Z
MVTLHLLGTGAAYTDAHRTTTMLAVNNGKSVILVDCGGDVVQRLLAANLDLNLVDGLIVTHEHPDHVGGFPLFMEKIWLAGRARPIDVFGIGPAIDQARRCLGAFNTSGWQLPSIHWHTIAYETRATVLKDEHWTITASPGVHGVPVVGLRIVSARNGSVIAYSCDTEPCETIIDLSRNADILVHEANGELPGHSSIEGAVGVATAAGARSLVLVHLPPEASEEELSRVRSNFPDVRFGEELETIQFRGR